MSVTINGGAASIAAVPAVALVAQAPAATAAPAHYRTPAGRNASLAIPAATDREKHVRYGVQLTPGPAEYRANVLYTLKGGTDGAGPTGGLLIDSAGSLYGTTLSGGDVFLDGTVFKLTKTASGYSESVIIPLPRLWRRAGAERWTDRRGCRFTVWHDAERWKQLRHGFYIDSNRDGIYERIVYNFGSNGDQPTGGLVADRSGNLYGTTGDCISGLATVFRLTPSTAAYYYTESTLFSFAGGWDGTGPVGPLVADSHGACTAQRITADRAALLAVIAVTARFDDGAIGSVDGNDRAFDLHYIVSRATWPDIGASRQVSPRSMRG